MSIYVSYHILSYVCYNILDLLGEDGLLPEDVLLSALGDDVNFDLLDDIQSQQQQLNVSSSENSSSGGNLVNESNLIPSSQGLNIQQAQFTEASNNIDPSTALTSASLDPKLFSALPSDGSNIIFSGLDIIQKGKDANVISPVSIGLAPHQIAPSQQHILQVLILKLHFVK